MRRTPVPLHVKMSTKLRGAQRSPELAFRSTDFRVPDLIFLALKYMSKVINKTNRINLSCRLKLD